MGQTMHQDEIERIFLKATELPADKRTEFVEQACSGQPESVKQVINELLDADQEASGPEQFLQAVDVNISKMVQSSQTAARQLTGERIGAYELIKRVASGGFGEVFLAERIDGLRRRVAIKILRAEVSENDSIFQRFEVER